MVKRSRVLKHSEILRKLEMFKADIEDAMKEIDWMIESLKEEEKDS